MTYLRSLPAPVIGALCASFAVFCFSVNDMAIKFLSGGYALHQLVLIRALVGLLVLFVVILPFSGGIATLRTQKLGQHLIRAGFVVSANMLFFLGLAAMPLAEASAIFFLSPLVITIFSIVFLRETVGPWRWAAIVVGLVGVIVIVRPGTDAFQMAALFPVAAALAYGGLHMMTRRMGGTESAVALTFYIQITFVLVSLIMGAAFGAGQLADQDSVSLQFLLRPWVWPDGADLWVFSLLGVALAFGGVAISQAYRMSEAALVAPFEYVGLPMAVFWGITVFGEWPDLTTILGIALILGSGLFMVWREARADRAKRLALRR